MAEVPGTLAQGDGTEVLCVLRASAAEDGAARLLGRFERDGYAIGPGEERTASRAR